MDKRQSFENVNNKKRKTEEELSISHQKKCESSDDEDEKENGIQQHKRKNWSDEEILYLVHFVETFGRSWVEIATNYEKYFNSRNAQDLSNKYVKLEKNVATLEHFKKQSELIKDVEKKSFEKPKYDKWDDEETIYLVHGVEKLGRNWVDILGRYKNHFKKQRDAKGLHSKYKSLENNKECLEYFMKKAALLN